uniref:Uncharacterized protein n=1 Tax=Vitis vinifera TaxID=29760 RepID=A5AUU3_VITVI|nr:hypothetical protein VITISV_023929 [Vitis vinifera]
MGNISHFGVCLPNNLPNISSRCQEHARSPDFWDLSGLLTGLSKEFNIEKFLAVFLDSLVDYSSSDDLCHRALISTIESVPVKGFVCHIVSRILQSCLRLSQKMGDSVSPESGSWAKQILVILNKNYPSELRGAVHQFLEDSKMKSKKEGSVYDKLCRILDGNLDMSLEISDSKIWFSLEHPKAEVRRATILDLNKVAVLKHKEVDSQETKREVCDRRFVASVWIARNKEWATLLVCGTLGGVLIKWDSTDVFSRMLTRVVERGILEGFLVGRSKTRVLYMQFADDTIFFSCAGVGEL